MSDTTTPATHPAQATATVATATSSSAFPWAAAGTIGSVITGLISAALGSSIYGCISIGVLTLIAGIGGPILWNKVMNGFNAKVDARDQANAGADAGNTSVDLANQGHDVRVGLDAQMGMDPPKKPQ